MPKAEQVKAQVSKAYAEMLQAPASCCEGPCSEGVYPVEVLRRMPEGVITFGCGNPVLLGLGGRLASKAAHLAGMGRYDLRCS